MFGLEMWQRNVSDEERGLITVCQSLSSNLNSILAQLYVRALEFSGQV